MKALLLAVALGLGTTVFGNELTVNQYRYRPPTHHHHHNNNHYRGAWHCDASPFNGYGRYYWNSTNFWVAYNNAYRLCSSRHGGCAVNCHWHY